jgi:tetratricopeptide (TPR) repeat protein
MAKETAIVLPAALFSMVVFVAFGKPGQWKSPADGHASFKVRLVSALRDIVPFLGVTVVYLLCRRNALGRISADTQHLPWRTVLLSWPATLWFYAEALFWPIRSRAFADPSLADAFTLRGVLLPGLGAAVAAAILVGVCIWISRSARRDFANESANRFPGRSSAAVDRSLVLGVSLMVLPILLTLNLNALNPGDFLHGRYTYLPLTGLSILVATGWFVTKLAKTVRFVFLGVAGLVLVTFSVLTIQQEAMWSDDLTVYTVAHEIAPHNLPVDQALVRAHVQGALALIDEGRCDQAVPIFEEAIQQYPQDWFAWGGLGECRLNLGDLPGAEQSLHRAYELSREPRVKEEWEQVRSTMGLTTPSRQ